MKKRINHPAVVVEEIAELGGAAAGDHTMLDALRTDGYGGGVRRGSERRGWGGA
jgi:hypothetical protein